MTDYNTVVYRVGEDKHDCLQSFCLPVGDHKYNLLQCC